MARRIPLLEFDLTLPIAAGIPGDAPPLEMTEEGTIRVRGEAIN
jgi:hypothetical protein